jgi:glycosyltransferase involved in cell wall biosynthesis
VLFEVTEIRPGEPDCEDIWGFSVDYPQVGNRSDASPIEIWGWVLGRSASAIAVEAVNESGVVKRAAVHGDRPDVALVYPDVPEAERSGFRFSVWLLNEGDVRLQVVLKDQRRIPLVTFRTKRRWPDEPSTEFPLVSVIIPSYNQAHFLHESIESVLAQTYPHIEIVVVDDGSSDNAVEVASQYQGTRYIRQENLGVSTARNTGIRHSTGQFLVFLDADDRLTPHALKAGLTCFEAHPESAFVYGRCRFIALDGAVLGDNLGFTITGDYYAAMLRRSYIPMPGMVMLRRTVLETVGPYDGFLSGCADYELYLRITRQFPISCHETVVAEYRQYGASLSRNTAQMLTEVLAVLRSQKQYVAKSGRQKKDFKAGKAFWQQLFGEPLAHQIRTDMRRKQWRAAMRKLATLVRFYPRGITSILRERI